MSSSSLSKLCGKRDVKWRPKLVLHLQDAEGSIAEIRSSILDFVYFAIQVGASIILPRFTPRSEYGPSSSPNGTAPFDTFFDADYFISTLASSCPELAIYRPENDEDMIPALARTYLPRSMRTDIDPAKTPAASVQHFNAWLDGHSDLAEITLVKIQRTLWQGPDTRSFPAHIRRDFGGLLRLNPTVRYLAAVATYNLAQRFHFPLDPKHARYHNAFFGAHIQLATDAASSGSGSEANASGQADAYIQQATTHNLKIIYTAGFSMDDLEDLEKFADDAWTQGGYIVTSAAYLLSSSQDDLKLFKGLDAVQRELVDYAVLARSSRFAGSVTSGFAWSVALGRSVLVEEEGRFREPLRLEPGDKDDGVALEDGLSMVWGRDKNRETSMIRGAWP
ncbi:hypothetical protein M8818_000845 [Zalaria obscura]|uniref:Uncharacterized protein n=1 Tax=Zalaria obscura TaxID=2024903 RepID=A0ACC3SNP8_9PEZI